MDFPSEIGIFLIAFFIEISCCEFYCLSSFRTNYAMAIGVDFGFLMEGIKTIVDFVCYRIQHFDLHL